MVEIWIKRKIDFQEFKKVMMIEKMMRLQINIEKKRVIIKKGNQGYMEEGNVIKGFQKLVMGGDLVIGMVVLEIIIIVNFMVIKKGEKSIEEVGERLKIDDIKGKKMEIDEDI